MGADYGYGILDYLPDALESLEEKLEFLQELAGLGLTSSFREIIDGRVVELSHKDGEVACDWLSDKKAAPILADRKKMGNGSTSYRSFPDCLDAQLYIPGTRRKGGPLNLADSSIEDWEYLPMSKAITDLERWVKLLESGEIKGDLGLTQDLLETLQLCKKHKLLFSITY